MAVQPFNIETVIAGAGPAGLATAACLQKKRRPFILLEKTDRIAASWHRHYDRLHLHTDKNRSELPYLSYPKHYPRYPSREQVIEYLESYARHFDLHPRFNQPVTSARFEHDSWHTRTPGYHYISRNLVIATGFNNQPHIPSWPGMEKFRGRILHSSDYRNGIPFQDNRVLVVGFGNSGGEIAIDLCEHGSHTALSVRGPVNIIPRDLFGLPILAIAIPLSLLPARLADAVSAPILRVVLGDIKRLGLQKLNEGPFSQIEDHQRIPLIDVGTVELIREGYIDVYPGIYRFTEHGVVFSDGSHISFDAVILATGYRPALNTFFEDASLDHKEQWEKQGLYFCGFYVSPTGVLREISKEAQLIARKIAASPNPP